MLAAADEGPPHLEKPDFSDVSFIEECYRRKSSDFLERAEIFFLICELIHIAKGLSRSDWR